MRMADSAEDRGKDGVGERHAHVHRAAAARATTPTACRPMMSDATRVDERERKEKVEEK